MTRNAIIADIALLNKLRRNVFLSDRQKCSTKKSIIFAHTFLFLSFITVFFIISILHWSDSPQWAGASSFTRFLGHIQQRNTVGRSPLGELLARRRDLYLTTHNTLDRHTSMPPVGFEPTILAGERPLGPAT
jgi:hypothetical protein